MCGACAVVTVSPSFPHAGPRHQGNRPLLDTFERQKRELLVTSPVLAPLFPGLATKGNCDAAAESLFSKFKGESGTSTTVVDALNKAKGFVQREVAAALQSFAGMSKLVTPKVLSNVTTAAAHRRDSTTGAAGGGASRRAVFPRPITEMEGGAAPMPADGFDSLLLSPLPRGGDAAGHVSEWGAGRQRVPRGMAGTRAGDGEAPEAPAPLPAAELGAAAGVAETEKAAKELQEAEGKLLRARQRVAKGTAKQALAAMRLTNHQEQELRFTAEYQAAYMAMKVAMAKRQRAEAATAGFAETAQTLLAPPKRFSCGVCNHRKPTPGCAQRMCAVCCDKARRRNASLACDVHPPVPPPECCSPQPRTATCMGPHTAGAAAVPSRGSAGEMVPFYKQQ